MKKNIKFVLITLFAVFSVLSLSAQKQKNIDRQALAAIKAATSYMIDQVSYNGGFVWEYLPDLSRQWGEMEARRSQAWTQGSATPAMGDYFLDLYKVTGDEYYYQCAEKVAAALIYGQLECGGWNYTFDFAGENALKEWYNTIGKNGWRLEEFHHYYGNATNDDDASMQPAQFILRIYSEKWDPKFRSALDKAINYVIKSQYPIGGWPQRYPLKYEYSKNGAPDYSSYITYNDGVHRNCIDFLLTCYQVLGDKSLLDPIFRAMNCTVALQQGRPQAGWAKQYSLDYNPAGARSYEPKSINPRVTSWCIKDLMDFYQITGDRKYLNPIPAAFEWLESVSVREQDLLPKEKPLQPGYIACPKYVEVGTNKGLFSHRIGTNVKNGKYVIAYDRMYKEYPSKLMMIDLKGMKDRYNSLLRMTVEEATKGSPLKRLEPFRISLVKLNSRINVTEAEAHSIISNLNVKGYWLSPLNSVSNKYIGDMPDDFVPSQEDYTQAYSRGDKYDTSPYNPDKPVMGITTKFYMEQVNKLISFLYNKK